MTQTVTILGAGPAGLALALKLAERGVGRIVVLDRAEAVGGLSASFCHRGLWLDYGSHRLHEATRPDILSDLKRLLGDDLVHRPRRGRILFQGRYIGYPLSPFDLLTHLPPALVLRFARDMLIPRRRVSEGSYAQVLRANLGPTMCETFYFPFGEKLWGLAPDEIAAEQARRRVSAGTVGRLLRRMIAALPGLRSGEAGHGYYYPRRGFGQISEAMAAQLRALGVEIRLGCAVRGVHLCGDRVAAVTDDDGREILCDLIFSTIPLPALVSALRPAAPEPAREGAERLRYRPVRFLYLILDTDQFTPFDAHYFPDRALCFSRLSEHKNYAAVEAPTGLTGLCVELPYWPGDATDRASVPELVKRVLADMGKAGLGVNVDVVEAFTRRYTESYPSYALDYAQNLAAAREPVDRLTNLVALGRQADFAHDNLHHALEVAYGAAECLGDDLSWDGARWAAYRESFAQHTVVD